MKIHERVDAVESAEVEFAIKISKESEWKKDLRMDDVVNIYAQCISNLSKENEELVFLNDAHKEIDSIFNAVSKKYGLTYGEKVKILNTMIARETKYIIRWERHKDFNKEGDLA